MYLPEVAVTQHHTAGLAQRMSAPRQHHRGVGHVSDFHCDRGRGLQHVKGQDRVCAKGQTVSCAN